jgi:hypothetical protein
VEICPKKQAQAFPLILRDLTSAVAANGGRRPSGRPFPLEESSPSPTGCALHRAGAKSGNHHNGADRGLAVRLKLGATGPIPWSGEPADVAAIRPLCRQSLVRRGRMGAGDPELAFRATQSLNAAC